MKLNYSTKASIIICAITYLLSSSSKLYAQVNTWTQQQPLGIAATPRYGAVSFSIGSKGYIGTGTDGAYKKDFWEYDQGTNIWTQKADFGGTARKSATGFAIGTKGYIGTGINASNRKDFWEYDPGTNIWIQKADFGGTARYGATGFAIGTKGYIGTGYIAFSNVDVADFWEYDPGTNLWTQKADFGGRARGGATGFAIGTKGYIGTGLIQHSIEAKDFWEYDPGTNIWIQKADFGGTGRDGATGFSIGNKGYIGTGVEDVGNIFGFPTKDFWEFDPGTNIWIQKADFGGTARDAAIGFAIGTNGYIGFGFDDNGSKNDLWKYSTTGVVLPVSLISFDGKRVIHENELKWQTAGDISLAYYSIEHSRDGVNFSALSSIHTTGNNQSAKSYSYTDHLPFSNITFYRLKLVDRDERFTYSKIIAVKDDKGKSLIVFPNPAKDILFVQVSRENEHASIQVLDATGRKIKEEKVDGNISISINIKDIPAGICTLVLKNQLKTEQQRFIKQ